MSARRTTRSRGGTCSGVSAAASSTRSPSSSGSQGSMCFGWSGKSAVIRSSNALRRPATMPQSKKTRFGSGSTRASQSNARKASGRSRALRLNGARLAADKQRVTAWRERALLGLAIGALVAAVPALLLHTFSGDQVYLSGMVHFICVGTTAFAATIAAVTLTIVGAKRRDGRTVLVGTAFSVMAALLALHGFASPGVIVGNNGVVAFTG